MTTRPRSSFLSSGECHPRPDGPQLTAFHLPMGTLLLPQAAGHTRAQVSCGCEFPAPLATPWAAGTVCVVLQVPGPPCGDGNVLGRTWPCSAWEPPNPCSVHPPWAQALTDEFHPNEAVFFQTAAAPVDGESGSRGWSPLLVLTLVLGEGHPPAGRWRGRSRPCPPGPRVVRP